jgi:LysM repeat protein
MIKNLRRLVLFLLSIGLAGCTPDADRDFEPVALTPWLTATHAATQIPAATQTPAAPATPAPTPTPIIHIVAVGETISSIALRYGLDMNAVLAANPEINPNIMIAGSQVIIPAGNAQTVIGVATEPLALAVSQPDCAPSAEGGWWCFSMVSNPLGQAAANISVTFIRDAGETDEEMTVPALLQKIEPGEAVPVLAFFADTQMGKPGVSARLASAVALDQSGLAFLPVDTSNSIVQINGRLAVVTGEALVIGQPGTTVDVRVAAMAFDADGILVGIRRTEDSRVTLADNMGVRFNLNVYSAKGDISTVIVRAEAVQTKP